MEQEFRTVRTVTLSLGEYNELVEDSIKLRLIVAACFSNSALGYDGKSLRFDDDDVNLALQVIDSARYRERMLFLTSEVENVSP